MAYLIFIFVLGALLLCSGPSRQARSEEACPLELKMFERDVGVAREMRERLLWKLAGANYKRRVMRSCTAEQTRASLSKLNLKPDELAQLGTASR